MGGFQHLPPAQRVEHLEQRSRVLPLESGREHLGRKLSGARCERNPERARQRHALRPGRSTRLAQEVEPGDDSYQHIVAGGCEALAQAHELQQASGVATVSEVGERGRDGCLERILVRGLG